MTTRNLSSAIYPEQVLTSSVSGTSTLTGGAFKIKGASFCVIGRLDINAANNRIIVEVSSVRTGVQSVPADVTAANAGTWTEVPDVSVLVPTGPDRDYIIDVIRPFGAWFRVRVERGTATKNQTAHCIHYECAQSPPYTKTDKIDKLLVIPGYVG